MKNNYIGKKLMAFALILVFSFIAVNNPSEAANSYTRIFGKDRFETSLEAAKELDSDIVVFANGMSFADALSSVNIVNTKSAKLILVSGSEDYSDYINEQGIAEVYIIGGTGVIGQEFEDKLKETEAEVTRLSGADRYLTNAETIKASELTEVGVASGENFADALAATNFLREREAGLVLVPKTNELSVEDVELKYAFGGKNAVDVDAEEVIAGKDRFETALLLADLTETDDLAFVNGLDFPDALSAVNIVNAKNVDVVFAPTVKNDKTLELAGLADEIYVIGGTAAVSNEAMELALKGFYEKVLSTLDQYEIVNIVSDSSKTYIRDTENNVILDKNEENNGNITIGDKRFKLADDNTLYTGWFEEGGKKYYSTAENGLFRGFHQENGKTYYFDPVDYNMYANGIFSTGEGVYWFSEDGSIRTGNKKHGYKGRTTVYWYGPNKEELNNKWVEDVKINGVGQKNRFLGQQIANFAISKDGLPFKWYGMDLNDPTGVYCIGATYSAYKEFGIDIPGPEGVDVKANSGYRYVQVQYEEAPKYGGKYIKPNFDNLIPGDLNYSRYRSGNWKNSHGAIYIGKNGGRPMTAHATLAGGFLVEPYSIVYTWPYFDIDAVRYLND